MRRNAPKTTQLPAEIRSDPVVQWAETVARDDRYRPEAIRAMSMNPSPALEPPPVGRLNRFL